MQKKNETIKDDIVSNQVLKNVKNQMETLQQKIDEHIGDSRNKFTAVKQDIIETLRTEIEEKVAHEIRDQMKKVSTTLKTMTKDMEEKVKNLTDFVDTVQSNLRETILSVDNNDSNLAEQLQKHSNKLEEFRSKLQTLNVNTKGSQNGMVKIKSTSEKHGGNLNVLNSTVGALNAQLNEINLRGKMKSIDHININIDDDGR
ncbi:unnamed protein product [Mytilus coruscus]|uniref:Uncharacterized protein n=1 Tax=Mytilus coruscus TaxID=42192 RepID=A0A6J8ADI7_MYTCO|nr:unnamed protein product [Mytilus coruscus]